MYGIAQYQQDQEQQQQEQQEQQLENQQNPLGATKTINLNSIHNHQRQWFNTITTIINNNHHHHHDEDEHITAQVIQYPLVMGDIGEIEKLQDIRQAGLQTPEYKAVNMDDHHSSSSGSGQRQQHQEIEDQNMESSSNNSPTDSINHNNNDDASNNNNNGNNNQETETYADANGDDPTHHTISDGVVVSGGDLMNDTSAMSGQMVVGDQANDSMAARNSSQTGFTLKPDGKSAKYPELKQYYNFGTWVGRNRKAICIRCGHTAASSQPLRLIKHLRKCAKLSDDEKLEVEDLLVYHQNKDKWVSKKVSGNMSLSEGDDSDIWGTTESPNKSATSGAAGAGASSSKSSNFHLPAPAKRVKREHPEWKATVDQALIRWIVHNRVPLKTIHSKEFLDFTRMLDPEYHMPSRETITNVLIPRALNII